jgi:surface polysaccharide O-acyltransferase-like enzyme
MRTSHLTSCVFLLEPLNAEREIYVPPGFSVSNLVFCIYGFHVILVVNRDYFLKQR